MTELIHPVKNEEGITPACSGTDMAAYFPEGKGAHGGPHELAIRICNGCELKDMCLDWSLQYEEYGIWGGYNATDRARIRAERGITLTAPEAMLDVLIYRSRKRYEREYEMENS